MKHSTPRSNRRSAFVLAAITALALPASALAQGARPEAEQLFRDGKQLLKEGRTAEACLAFEASEKAEPNIATLLSLADCHEKAGQYASAWARFLNAESRTRGEPGKQGASLNRTARERAAALEGKLSYLTINVPDESRVEGLLVTRDGIEVDAGQWNRAVPVDGGLHVISGKAPGHESWSTQVTLSAENEKRAVEVPKFKELPKLVAPEPRTVAMRRAASGDDDLAVTAASEPSPFTPRRKLALGLAGGGVVAAGTAIGFGLAARNLRNEALGLCSASACTPDEATAAQDKNDRARRFALIANIGYGVAGGAAIAATVLWFTSAPERPAPDETALSISPLLGNASGVAVSGGF
jgi:hypothetical protein